MACRDTSTHRHMHGMQGHQQGHQRGICMACRSSGAYAWHAGTPAHTGICMACRDTSRDTSTHRHMHGMQGHQHTQGMQGHQHTQGEEGPKGIPSRWQRAVCAQGVGSMSSMCVCVCLLQTTLPYKCARASMGASGWGDWCWRQPQRPPTGFLCRLGSA